MIASQRRPTGDYFSSSRASFPTLSISLAASTWYRRSLLAPDRRRDKKRREKEEFDQLIVLEQLIDEIQLRLLHLTGEATEPKKRRVHDIICKKLNLKTS